MPLLYKLVTLCLAFLHKLSESRIIGTDSGLKRIASKKYDDPLLFKYDSLRGKIKDVKTNPLYEFRDEMDEIIKLLERNENKLGMISELDLNILFTEYTNSLQRVYLLKFLSEAQNRLDDPSSTTQTRNSIIKECRAAMRAAVPVSRVGIWDYGIQLEELAGDMDKIISNIRSASNETTSKDEDENNSSLENLSTQKSSPSSTRKVWLGRLRWFSAQLLLFSISFIQNEWQRRSLIRNCERRLAEVSEFPLL